MLMADLGAEVIKIEVPEIGDNSRGSTVLPGMPSTYFETNNRGVKSVTLNLKTEEGREILRKLVARADIFGQNFRPGAAEKNGFGYEELLSEPQARLCRYQVTAQGPDAAPGTDSMAQALGGIAEAYSTPGHMLKTGIVSVADETCAILAFGGALAALTHARATGVGQKVDCSLLGGQIRLMGWTLTTAMWRNRDPVTGQARITGTQERPGISASFNDRNGKPLVPAQWRPNGAGDDPSRLLRRPQAASLAISVRSSNPRRSTASCACSTNCSPPACATIGWRGCVAASSRRRSTRCSKPQRSRRRRQRPCRRVDYPQYGKRPAVHGRRGSSETPARDRRAPELGADNDAVLTELGYTRPRSTICTSI
jgi:crotonobetainyl-CoA:carnitine CoA-transferase CaiB-like acyl-CoA transferase